MRMRRRSIPTRVSLLLVGLVTLALDLLTKHLAQQDLKFFTPVWLVPGALSLTRVSNAGAAFGLMGGGGPVLVVVGAAAVVLLPVLAPRILGGTLGVPLGLMWGGSAGNLYDRLTGGQVVDFIHVRFWPGIFNLADLAIVVGGVWFAVGLWKHLP